MIEKVLLKWFKQNIANNTQINRRMLDGKKHFTFRTRKSEAFRIRKIMLSILSYNILKLTIILSQEKFVAVCASVNEENILVVV